MLNISCVITIILVLLVDQDDAILDGELATYGQFQYQVLLKLEVDGVVDLCSGAIIDDRHIITAWHCVDNVRRADIKAFVGGIQYEDDPMAEVYTISNVRLHEKRCINGSRCYDIAVLTTAEKIEYERKLIGEVPMPEEPMSPGEECVYAGWGINEEHDAKPSDELRFAYGKIYARMFCVGWLVEDLQDYEFCIRPVRDSSAIMHAGDSGAPLVCDGILTGIAIRGIGEPNYPVIVVDVFELREYIQRAQDSDSCHPSSEEERS